MNKYIYLLQHSSNINDSVETKIIGIFTTYAKAEDSIKKFYDIKGFKDYKDDFYIDKYPLDKEFWLKGFSTQIVYLN